MQCSTRMDNMETNLSSNSLQIVHNRIKTFRFKMFQYIRSHHHVTRPRWCRDFLNRRIIGNVTSANVYP